MPLRKDLLNPFSAGKPSGENLRYAPVYDKIKEARREDDDAPQGDWKRERKVADWPLAIKLIGDALATQTKDLQLAAWLAEAMLRREGVAGLREVLELIRGYLENFWDTLYPELDDGDAEYRAAPLQWVGDRLESAVKRGALTRSGLDWFQYKESRSIGTEESADTDDKRQVRQDAIADGKIQQEQFDKAFEETPKKFYVNLLETCDGTLESLSTLGNTCDEKFGDVAPSFGTLKRVLEEVRQTVYILLQLKREKEPDEVVAAPEPEGEAEPAYEGPDTNATNSAAAPVRVRTGSLGAEPVDRDDAIARVVAAARFLRRQEPYSPAPFLMLRGLRWGELRAGGTEVDQMLLAAPPSEIRQNLKRLSLEGNWTEVLETAETAMGMECGRGWLDLQRYACRACFELGHYYGPLRNAVISDLRALLADYPKLPDLTMMDDTSTANGETLAWLKEDVLAAAEPADLPGSYQRSYQAETAEGPGASAPPDTFALALQAARAGRPREGIQMLMREMGQEPSGRGRFCRKMQLTKLCDSTGYDAIALPILQEMASEIEHRKLEDWEAAELVAEPLALLHRCLCKNGGDAAEIQKLYSWICRLDPLEAMNISR
jgi:type VI secretion system protein ImpA